MEKKLEVKEGESRVGVNQPLDREKLENIAHQLSEQSRQLYAQNQELRKKLQEADMAGFFKRLDYLWMVINSDNPLLSQDFLKTCAEEFMQMMKAPEAEEETTVKE